MVENVSPGIVLISTNSTSGTGIVYETTGRKSALIITNYHVIERASRIDVLVDDLGWYQGKLLKYDESRDVALLEICCGDFYPLTFRRANTVKAGTEVIAIGYALGIPGSPTVTRGIVSAYRLDPWGRGWIIQTDAPINPGNSGGPLLLPGGEVIGINTYRYTSDRSGNPAEGLGFALSEYTFHGAMAGWRKDLNLVPVPTPKSIRWRTYTSTAYDYSIAIPADWGFHGSDESSVAAFGPNASPYFRVFIPDELTMSAEAWSQFYIDFVEQSDHEYFELLQHQSRINSNGDQIAYVHFRWKITQDSCAEDERAYLLVTRSGNYLLGARTCEESLNQYEGVVEAFFDSFTILR